MMDKTDIPKPFDFHNSYVHLPEKFYQHCAPAGFSGPSLIAFNHALASELRLHVEGLSDAQLADIFSGNVIPEGAEPIAMAYAGHQFAHFVPQLGDGRAILLGEVLDAHGARRDIQLKGCGQTLFSRRGDGRAALGPVMREYVVSEAMHALGIKTTRSLAAVATGEMVFRETALPGAVLTRIAASHIRIGTFEYFAARDDKEAVHQLADYVIERHYPEARKADNPYVALLESSIEAQAALIASWMHVGFIHGVMNTDNMALSGETIDYGPCAFMDHYDPMMVFSSIDRHGRYAFGNQPAIAQWNLVRFAETLLPLLDADQDKAVAIAEPLLNAFIARFQSHWLRGMRQKIGLYTEEEPDLLLVSDLLGLMHENAADYTNTFRVLCDAVAGDTKALAQLLAGEEGFDIWTKQWHARLGRESLSASECAARMRAVNPAYIPRNHRIEQAIAAVVERNDFSIMKQMMEVLSKPFEEQDGFAEYALPPVPTERVYQTFCGT
jgi:uncharacterized protein YdiU (UPF0061 family)